MSFLFPAPCVSCGVTSGLRRYTCPQCNKAGLCSTCIDNAALISPSGDPLATDTVVKSVCEACFVKSISLDLTTAVDVLGAADGAGPAIVFVHGAGGSREMYRYHAAALASQGCRCVLLDLPGHGALFRQPLTLDSAIDTIVAVTQEHCKVPFQGHGPMLVGGSLGGFIGMELLGRHPTLFSRAAICCADQCVGSEASFKARAGLFMMNSMISLAYCQTFVNLMLSVTKGSKDLDADLLRPLLKTGFYFGQGKAHIVILRATKSIEAMKKYPGAVLYIDGSKDHHDMQYRLVGIAKKKNAASRLRVFDGGDHFFSHDKRFVATFIQDLSDFAFCRDTQSAADSTQ